jgi:penicillin V acylase-like amidase (Ntn superfamily)
VQARRAALEPVSAGLGDRTLRNIRLIGLATSAVIALTSFQAQACTRFLYKTGTNGYIVGRSMDWAEDPQTDLWAFPRGLSRDGGAGPGSLKWTSKYGSVIASFYNIGTVDGMNDAGLVANALYLVEADYGDAKASGKPPISIGAWTQYALDNYGTVAEAVAGLSKEPFVIVAPDPTDTMPAVTSRSRTPRAIVRSLNTLVASSSSTMTANIR